ncbi:MAG: DUF116 domain-containing protein [Candidatus Thorarchaeota archaeon]|nr:DUF116 domain-containing protein [Candidatus Thorarchaeota archaeon]
MLEQTKTSDAVELPEGDIRSRIIEHLEIAASSGASSSPEVLAESVITSAKLVDEELINFTLIEATNVLNRSNYEQVPIEDRILLIPHCLRDAEACIAPIDEEGYHCQKCGACVIADITAEAEAKGIKWYMVGGGSHAIRIVKNARPKAVLGIACFDDAKLATEKINSYGIPTQAVLLSKAGCVNTEVDCDLVSEAIEIEYVEE